MSNNYKDFSHLDKKGSPQMVDVSPKDKTIRVAKALSIVELPADIMKLLKGGEIYTAKGPVFHTGVIAGIMAAKKTAELIPMCHPLFIEKCNVDISIQDDRHVRITCEVQTEGRTGVEMEALTGASVAALTVYDMCKGISQDMTIRETKLLFKSGGKTDINRG